MGIWYWMKYDIWVISVIKDVALFISAHHYLLPVTPLAFLRIISYLSLRPDVLTVHTWASDVHWRYNKLKSVLGMSLPKVSESPLKTHDNQSCKTNI